MADYVVYLPTTKKTPRPSAPAPVARKTPPPSPPTRTTRPVVKPRPAPAAPPPTPPARERDDDAAERCARDAGKIDEKLLEDRCGCSKVFHGGSGRILVSYQCGDLCVHDSDHDGTWEKREGSCGSFL